MVNDVTNVGKVDGSSSYWSYIRWIRKPLRCLEALGKLIDSSLKAVESARPGSIPTAVSYASKGPRAVQEVLKIRNVVKGMRRLISSPDGTKKFRAFVSLTVNMNTVLDSVAIVCAAVRAAVGPAAQRAVQWIPILSVVGFVSNFLALGLSAYSAYRARTLFTKIQAASKKFFDAATDDERTAAVNALVDILEKDGMKPLRRYLAFSKKAFPKLGEQIETLKQHTLQKDLDAQDTEFVQMMREKPFFSFYTHLDAAVSSLASIGRIISTAAKGSIRWISLLNILGFISSFLSLGISIYSIRGARALLKGFNDAMEKYLKAEKEGNADGQVEALQEALAVIDAEGIVPLRTHLMMSRKVQKTLATRVDSLRGRIGRKEIHKDDKELIGVLAGRAKTASRFEVASVAADIVGVAGGIILATPVPVAGQVAGFSVLAASSAISLVAIGTKYLFIRKDPFDPMSQNRMMRMLSSLSKAVEALSRHCSSKPAPA